jgi:hypothetical protein
MKSPTKTINGGYIGISFEKTQDPAFNFLNLAIPLNSLDGSNPNVIDYSSKNNSITNNSVTWNSAITGKFYNGASSFNGSSSYLSIGSTASHGVSGGSGGSFTIEAYIYSSNVGVGTRSIFEQRQNATSNLKFYTNAAKLSVDFNGITKLTSSSDINVDTWYHVSLQRNTSGLSMFINGVSVASTSISGILTSASVNIGRSVSGSQYWSGYIQDLKVYSNIPKYLGNFGVPSNLTGTARRYPSGIYPLG